MLSGGVGMFVPSTSVLGPPLPCLTSVTLYVCGRFQSGSPSDEIGPVL
jgi:hypothetical protein